MADFSQFGFTPEPAAAPPGGNAYADLGFTPAGAPDDANGQQKAQGAVSKFLGELWDQTAGQIGPTVRHVSGWDDWMKARDQMKAGDYAGAGTTLLTMANAPGRLGGDVMETSKDQVARAGQALKDGRYHDAALHINAAIPIVGTAFAQGVNGLDKMAQGNHAEGAADVVANLGTLALPVAVEEAAGRAAPHVRAQLQRAAPVVKAAVDAGAPDIAMGALKVGAGAAADAVGIPGHVATIMGAREGVPQIARGVAKGFKAGRQVIRERATPPPLPSEAPAEPAVTTAQEPPPVPPYFAGGSTSEPAASVQSPPAPVPEGGPASSTVSPYAGLGFIPESEVSGKITTPESATTSPEPSTGGSTNMPENIPAPAAVPATLYHGSQSPELTFQPGETYMTADPAEAAGFGEHVHEIQPRPGVAKDVNPAVDEAIAAGDDLDETLRAEAEKARQEGHRYITFDHPSSDGSKPNFPATVSLFTHEDLTPVSKTPAADIPASNTPQGEAPRPLEEPAYEHAQEPAPGEKPDYQAAARTVKGRALARFLHNPPEGPSITAEEATRMTPDQWQIVAREASLAAKKPPSPETVAIAIDHLKELEAKRAQRSFSTGTEDPGAQPAAGATLPADGQASPTGEPVQAPDQGARGQGVPVPAAAQPGGEPGRGANEVEIPGEGRSIPARYAVRELADVQSSHNGLNFQPNPRYTLVNERNYTKPENQGKVINGSGGKFKPSFHITDNPDPVNGPPIVDSKGNAIGGNGRTMQLQRVYAYNPEGAAAYRAMLTKKAAQFGIDPATIDQFKQPVLVREVADADLGPSSHAIGDLNKSGTAALMPAERAIADSRRVSPATLDDIQRRLEAAGPDATLSKILATDDGHEIMNRLVDDGVLTQQETAAYVKGGKLTPAGKTRVSKLMLGRFFRDPDMLDTTPGPIVAKLERLAAPVAKLESAGAWSLMPQVQEALDLIDEARVHGTRNLSEFLKQSGLLGESRYTASAVTMAKALQRFTGRQLAASVKDYAATAQYAAEHADAKAGLFGADVKGEAPTPAEAFEAAFRPGKQAPAASSAENPQAKAKNRKTAAQMLGDQFKD